MLTPEQFADAVLLEYDVTADDGGDLRLLMIDAFRQAREQERARCLAAVEWYRDAGDSTTSLIAAAIESGKDMPQ